MFMGFFRILILFFLLQNFDWFCLVLQYDLHSNYTVNYAYLESRKDRAVPWEWDFADRLRRAEWSGHIGADVCRGVCSMFWGQPESLPLCWQSCCDRKTGASLP